MVWLVSAKLDIIELISEEKSVLVLESISVSRAEVDFDVSVVLISLVVLVLEIKFVIERSVDIDVSKAEVKFSIVVVSNVASEVRVELDSVEFGSVGVTVVSFVLCSLFKVEVEVVSVDVSGRFPVDSVGFSSVVETSVVV